MSLSFKIICVCFLVGTSPVSCGGVQAKSLQQVFTSLKQATDDDVAQFKSQTKQTLQQNIFNINES